MKKHMIKSKGEFLIFLILIFIMTISMFSKVLPHKETVYISEGGLIDRIEPDSIDDYINI